MFAAPVLAKNSVFGVFKKSGTPEFKLPDLPYAYNALEPYIDEQTMTLHHSKHHAGYTQKFNAAVKAEGIQAKNAREILMNVSKYSEAVRNNGGGYFNHKLYWNVMSPNGGGTPGGDLLDAINGNFGSFDNFKEKYSTAAKTIFGSGWAWLIIQNGKLKITTTPNQDSPLMDIVDERGIPIMCIDVWEHAYYLKYQNRRAEYVDAFWNIVNWNFISEKFTKKINEVI
ncbi:MAG: superoxide dismutase [Bacteroidales bacterium]|nr:superoxide dismutase [Bacteroidales bacterium]